jgi:hypothetical protein
VDPDVVLDAGGGDAVAGPGDVLVRDVACPPTVVAGPAGAQAVEVDAGAGAQASGGAGDGDLGGAGHAAGAATGGKKHAD